MGETSVFTGKKAKYFTLGCKLNFSETATFGQRLRSEGVADAKEGEAADICIVNTCAVTETAAGKCRQAIRRIVRCNPGAFVVVTGCFAQLEPDAVACIKGVGLVLGSNEKARLTEYLAEALANIREEFRADKPAIQAEKPACRDVGDTKFEAEQTAIQAEKQVCRDVGDTKFEAEQPAIQAEEPAKCAAASGEKQCFEREPEPGTGGGNGFSAACHRVKTKDITSFAPSCSRGNRTRYFLKVQDGCNYYCTYCAIPFARGRSRNPSIASLAAQAEAAAGEGGREIVLTGVNIGDFGRSTGERFIDLIKALDKVEGIARYRISSIEPDLLDDEIIRYCACESGKFMPHFHIPLQSGSDEVLRLMRRRYGTKLFEEKIKLIKSLLPHAFIGVDLMVGCRGETKELFDDCYAFVKSLPLSKLHVFPYSERPGTAALKIEPSVCEREKREREEKFLALSEEKQRGFYASFIGDTRPVLFERAAKGKCMHGFTDNYIRVELPASAAEKELDNEIRLVRLGKFCPDGKALECSLVE